MGIRGLLEVAANGDDDWLRQALQSAVELEFFTIPPYLTAMWSIVDQDHAAARIIREVVYEEMQHMALACNLLAAIGGTPCINRTPAIPVYPRPLPGGVKPQLIVGLVGFSKETADAFMEIEKPERPLAEPEMVLATYPRIGAFYTAIEQAILRLQPELNVERQVAGPLAPLVIATLEDAVNAINRIRVQGEGTDVSPADDAPEHLAHYYLFRELRNEKRLAYDAQRKQYYNGGPLPFPAVYPVARVPAGGYRYDEVAPQVAQSLREFDLAYSQLLDDLHGAWNGGGQASLLRAIEGMFSLMPPARALMACEIPGTMPVAHYGPNFRYVDPHQRDD